MRAYITSLIALFTIQVNAQSYFLNGDAIAIGDDCYQLTASFNNQNGTVWYSDQINLALPFDLQFTMNFGNSESGADGICFVLHTLGTSAIGAQGEGMGYSGFGTSLGIEFDTYQNGNLSDPVEDHIAIEYNGDVDHFSESGNIAGPVQADADETDIEDNEDHVVRITWQPDSNLVSVYFDCEFRLSGTIDMVNEIFGGQQFVYWGFTAATGGSVNTQVVCLQENILNVPDVEVCNGGSVTLNAGSSIDGVYEWTPQLYLDDPTSPSPVATPPVSTEYYVSFLDLCGQQTELQVMVSVIDLELSLGEIPIVSCTGGGDEVNASINMNTNGVYTWTLNGETVLTGPGLNSLFVNQPGTYNVSVNVNGACFADSTFIIQTNDDVYTAAIAVPEELNCFNPSITLDGSTNGADALISWTYNGNPIAGGLDLSVSDPGNYLLEITHPVSGCSSSASVSVTEDFTTPSVSLGDQDSLSCAFPQVPLQNVTINSTNDYSVMWTTNNGIITGPANTLNPAVAYPAFYTITVQDSETGCSESDSVYVGQLGAFDIDFSSLTFPNIITSNGDSKNDAWKPFLKNDPTAELTNAFREYELLVYNRWGNLIFESRQYITQWNARDSGEGVYFYILRFQTYCGSGEEIEKQGHIQVVEK